MARTKSDGTSGDTGLAGKLKLSDSEPIVVDPASLGSSPADSGSGSGTIGDDSRRDGDDRPRKRGRPRSSDDGTGTGSAKKKTPPLDVDGLSAILLSSHQMLASLTRSPLLVIDENEAKVLGRGVANVAKHYHLGGASAKTLDWFNLFQALALVYGPRIFVASQAAKQRKAERAANTQTVEPTAGPDFNFAFSPGVE